MKQYNRSGCPDSTGQQHIPYVEGRVDSVDNGIFIHAIVPRHVETCVLLSKLKVEHYIEVDLNLDEIDLTSAEMKASYREIKEYVQEKFGLSVSNLYIAQVKRKYGIIERDNYNLPKSDDTKQPQCPMEKEKAIVDALRYFRMI